VGKLGGIDFSGSSGSGVAGEIASGVRGGSGIQRRRRAVGG
jgi:hypothetical protein